MSSSPFLSPGSVTTEGQLASLHLRRDHSIPVVLNTMATTTDQAGYAEGNVTNTRFGSFPHSTLIGVPWGSQVRASLVDTGTRGRTLQGHHQQRGKKRKAESLTGQIEDDENSGTAAGGGGGLGLAGERPKQAVTAGTGFLHVLQPTPENWTMSLPHRTQVVYTPDYSYVLHRLRVRPGSVVIEAGSGSGSFTHAAARAVFNGYGHKGEDTRDLKGCDESKRERDTGKIFTYEFHAGRHEKLQHEMRVHGLDSVVTTSHRDVYKDGFLLPDGQGRKTVSPRATAVFLDLPAPWEALPHLSRQLGQERPAVLDPHTTAHICTFSPCVEQAQKTVSALRKDGWLDIEMVEILHHRIEIRREYTGYQYEGLRGVNAMAKDVDEAIEKLRRQENRAKGLHSSPFVVDNEDRPGTEQEQEQVTAGRPNREPHKVFKQGRLVHRSEPELKTHTSYLVFAVLPREWSTQDEERARRELASIIARPTNVPKSQRQLKKEAKRRNKDTKEADMEDADSRSK